MVYLAPLGAMDALALHRVTIATNRPERFTAICTILARYGILCSPGGRGGERDMLGGADDDSPEDLLLIDQRAFADDGLAIMVHALRQVPERPVMMIGEDSTSVDRTLVLEMGADDHVDLACDNREMVARMRAIIRRTRGARLSPAPIPAPVAGFCETAHFLQWRLDLIRRALRHEDGREIILPPGEFSILLHLLRRQGVVVDRAMLGCGGLQEGEDRRVDVLISRLRRRLDTTEEVIRTVRGRGYLFLPDVHWDRGN